MQRVAGGLEFYKGPCRVSPLSPRGIGDFIRRRVRHLPQAHLTKGSRMSIAEMVASCLPPSYQRCPSPKPFNPAL